MMRHFPSDTIMPRTFCFTLSAQTYYIVLLSRVNVASLSRANMASLSRANVASLSRANVASLLRHCHEHDSGIKI